VKVLHLGRVGVPPAVFRVSRNTRRTSLRVTTSGDVRRVLRRMRSTAGGTPTLPERADPSRKGDQR